MSRQVFYFDCSGDKDSEGRPIPVIEFYDPPDGRKFNAVIVSNAEMDAAWAAIINVKQGDIIEFEIAQWVEARIFAPLGIVRCKRCDRQKRVWTESDGYVTCPDCNGHGWGQAAEMIEEAGGPAKQEVARVGDDWVDMKDLPKIDAVRFYNGKGDTIVIGASFVASQMYRAGSDEPLGSVKTDRFSEPPPPKMFKLVRFDLLDENGETLAGPIEFANPQWASAGDAADIALEDS
jgi:hypothetical protein